MLHRLAWLSLLMVSLITTGQATACAILNASVERSAAQLRCLKNGTSPGLWRSCQPQQPEG